MRLVFVNRFYWPETPATAQLLTDLAESLAHAGHEVHVIASRAMGCSGSEERHGVRIHRVACTRSGRHGLTGKGVDLLSFYASACFGLLRIAAPDTTVVAMTDPPLLGIGAWLVARLRGARIIHWVQDIYPEVAMELSGQHALALLRPPRDLAWRGADACVLPGGDMAAVVERAGVPVERRAVIANWAPVGIEALPRRASEELRRAWGLEGRFVVAYSGNLGRVHDLEPVLSLAEKLRGETSIAIAFIGGGPQRPALEQQARERGLANVSFHPPQPRSLLSTALAAGDVHLVTLRPGCERWVFPSKLYGIAAAARPVLFIGPTNSEIAHLIRRHNLGIVVAPDDVEGAASAIVRLRPESPDWQRHAEAAAVFAREQGFSAAAAAWRNLLDRHNALHPAASGAAPLRSR